MEPLVWNGNSLNPRYVRKEVLDARIERYRESLGLLFESLRVRNSDEDGDEEERKRRQENMEEGIVTRRWRKGADGKAKIVEKL
jgi:hypothetical protein